LSDESDAPDRLQIDWSCSTWRLAAADCAVFQEHQHRLDPSVHRVIAGESELGEDGIDVLFHRPLSQDQPLRHRTIASAGGEFGENFRLSPRQRLPS
jgi:hypothetical protein